MARSFFTARTDAELYTGSAAFTTKIVATPTAYGLTAAIASSYSAVNTTFADAYMVATDPETRTKGTVKAKDDAAVLLRQKAAEVAQLINGTSTVTDQQRLDLGLSVRKTPAPMGPPGTPGNFGVTLSADGSIDITWKCSNPTGSSGTMYQVFRRTTPDGEFSYVGGTGEKKITDAGIPAGTTQLTYQIQAVRSTAAGPWATFNVCFGPSSSGAITASVSSTTKSPKLAA